jgi:hypothetical protein
VITLELLRCTRDGQHSKPRLAARIRADRDGVSVDGPEPDLVDLSQPVLNLGDGRTITCDDDPEEWVRGLAVSFRTPYLSTCVVEETNLPPDVDIQPASVHEPSLR